MTERLARPADAHEAKAFDRIRSRFIEEAAKHLDIGQGIAAVIERPDHYFATLMELRMAAHYAGQPDPNPWFTDFCVRMLDEQDGTRRPPPKPVVN